jgi:uncharacterized protein YcfL
MRYLLLVVLLLVLGCSMEQRETIQSNGSVYIENSGGGATVSIVKIEGHKYCVLVGYKKAAICPTAETLRWANQQ